MLHSVVKELTSAHLVAAFQRWCGVDVEQRRVAVQDLGLGLPSKARPTTANGCQHRSVGLADDMAPLSQSSPSPSASSASSTRHVDIWRRRRRHHHYHHHNHAPQCVHGLADRSSPNNPHSVTNGETVVNGCVHDKDVVNGGVSDGGSSGSDCEFRSRGHTQDSVSNGVAAALYNNSQPPPHHHHHHHTQRKQHPSNGTAQTCCDGGTPPLLPPDSSSHHLSFTSSPCCCCCCWTGWEERVEEEEEEEEEKSQCVEGGGECVKGGGGSSPEVVIRYPLLYYWARLGAALGNEHFYLSGMPFLLWTVDSAVVRQTALLWWVVMYVGQALKDYLGWPRPPSPPVVHLETAHLAEFSMPSTHAMAGTAIPLLLATLLLQRYQLPAAAVVCVAALWCATTCLSRLYLGVHTVLDVVCGMLLALLLYLLLSPLIPLYDLFQQTHPLAPVLLLPASLALCTVCYPSGSRHSAKGDAVIITAVIVGVGLGSWLNYQLGWSLNKPQALPMPVPSLTCGWLVMGVLQFVVGVAVVGVVKVVMKPVAVWLFCWVLGVQGSDLPHEGVTLGYRYTTYMCLGLCIVFVDPLIFTLAGFGRDGYYEEVV